MSYNNIGFPFGINKVFLNLIWHTGGRRCFDQMKPILNFLTYMQKQLKRQKTKPVHDPENSRWNMVVSFSADDFLQQGQGS